jgi:glycosyltransferase involved in cell wall biosynthesis
MKVLQLVADGAPGGGTNHVLQLLRGLNHCCELVLLTQEDSYLQQQAEELGIHVVTGDFFRSRVDPSAVRLVSDTIRQHKPHVIHCHGGRAAFFRSFVSDVTPSLYTVHGFHFARKNWPARVAGWLGEYLTIPRMQEVVFVSDFDRRLALRSGLLPSRKPIRVIHNGIPAPKVDRCEPKEKLGVGFIGRMVYQKNPQLFVDVIERLPTVKAVMVGGGDLERDVQRMIQERGLSDRVQLYGSLGHKEALEVLSKLDVLLMTPRWEGLPLLPLEAMFLNVPVVSTSSGGIPEVIEHERTGMLAATEAAGELTNHVQKLLQDASLRNRIVNNAAKQVAERFGEEAMLRSIRERYQSLSRKRSEPKPSFLPSIFQPFWTAAKSL